MKLPKSRCSRKKFLSIIHQLSEHKLEAIRGFGFGGLIHLACREIRYELCHFLISHYEVAYHRIRLKRDHTLDVIIDDVINVMGIPLRGPNVIVHLRHGLTSQVYSLNRLEESLIDLEVNNEFQKVFIIFSCATILAPNSKLEGIHDLWDLIWDGEVNVQRNWSKFVLQYLEMELGNSRVAMTYTYAVVCSYYRYLHFFRVDACCYECDIIWFIMSTHLSLICRFFTYKKHMCHQ